MRYLLSLDQGTSSSRSIIFDEAGKIVASAQTEFSQIYPHPGWVEHDPIEIWQTQLRTIHEVLIKSNLKASDIACIGITNQRETTVVWNKHTGIPVYNAIVWQDRRSEPLCQRLRDKGLAELFQQKTGLIIDAYFSATKLKWILDEVPGAQELASAGDLIFGTIDTWLLYQLTRAGVHATDVSNAARTMMFNINTNTWDEQLLELLSIPPQMLPRVQPSASYFGSTIPDLLGSSIAIGGMAGDQQSALFGQACFYEGMAKNTYGTGCFMLMQTGSNFNISQNRLITTSAAQTTPAPQFALEGSVFIGGAVVQWLRDGLGAIKHSKDIEALSQSVPDSAGVVLVPAFTGLGAPYWDPHAQGLISGITRGTTVAHIARAALESIAFQSAALLDAMSKDALASGAQGVKELRVDGGACVNDLLMQFQSDLLGIPVLRPAVTETTALGAAYLAGLTCGIFKDIKALSALWVEEKRFTPMISSSQAAARMQEWEHGVRRARAA